MATIACRFDDVATRPTGFVWLRIILSLNIALWHSVLVSDGNGWLHFELPGVFANNPCPDMVNLSLWTLPFELACYVILVLVLMTRNAFGGHVLTALIAGLQLILFLPFLDSLPNEDILGPQLSLCFLVGAALYIHRRRIPFHGSLALAALIATVLLLELPGGISLVPLPAAYLTVYIGLLTPQLPKILKTGDYSYGIYLYSFPIQQAVASQAWAHTWWINALISLPLTLLAAAASYHFLERHMAALKPYVRRLEDGLFHRSNPFKRLRPWLRLTSRRRIRHTRVVRNTA
ncbi:hypothetical protein AEAC466_20120 [Asticcacaulis sp. AC466]|nr:hypothetical protein AEAC466_20120 [Asticcacaulis sp. AC466]